MYVNAYKDSFHIGVGATAVTIPWMFTSNSLVPFVVGAMIIPLVLFIIPMTLVAVHARFN